ncbi:MAG: sulfate ABC transporter substrate-binding protein [Lentisphaerae bacterium]|jgi:sulfate/thiosulfate-binding protein|nr:sulfate ABC transporter substrate-binding protein [Lentisphaerota bacterium]
MHKTLSQESTMRYLTPISLVLLIFLTGCSDSATKRQSILNVSYDPTRELYKDINQAFLAESKLQITIEQSHGGSGKQARSVLDGLEADVVTLALAYDIDILATQGKLIPEDWQDRLPNHSSPYFSTIVFLVRKGNPKEIFDWGDLIKPNVEVITPNPKTSGGARWNYLAAWSWAEKNLKDENKVLGYMTNLFKQVPVLDTGARGSTLTFAQRKKGDVLLAWENEALLAVRDYPDDQFEIVHPSISILAEPAVAIIDASTEKHKTRDIAQKYLDFLYSDTGQAICAKHFYRIVNPNAADPKDLLPFKTIELVNIREHFGGWKTAHEKHFADNATFDAIIKRR